MHEQISDSAPLRKQLFDEYNRASDELNKLEAAVVAANRVLEAAHDARDEGRRRVNILREAWNLYDKPRKP